MRAALLVDQMRGVKPEQKVKVRVLRDGKNKDFVVVARPDDVSTNRMFNVRRPGDGAECVDWQRADGPRSR